MLFKETLSLFLFIDNEYLVTEVGGRCEKNYVSIQDQAECNLVSKKVVLSNQAFEGWSTASANDFKPGNNFTSGNKGSTYSTYLNEHKIKHHL